MSIRVTVLIIAVVCLSLYAYRDWFVSLCGAILLMAVIEHPDMPKTILGIQGLNFWNVLLLNILIPWFVSRRREGRVWDMPRWASGALLLYFLVVFAGFLRMMDERLFGSSTKFIPQAMGIEEYSLGYLISENLINSVKWVIPGMLLFDGCRDERRMKMGLVSILGLFVLLALQVIRWVPPSYALDGHALMVRSRKILVREVGYHAVNLSMMLAAAFWAIVASLSLVKQWWKRIGVMATAMTVAYAQALTAGRMGYASWACVGLTLCALKWRKYLVLFPLVPLVIALAVPGSVERFTQGFGTDDATKQSSIDSYEVTSGRTLIWPYVVEKFMESPVVGYGRLAMIRTGLRDQMWEEYAEAFPHPHNAYLEMLLDNGVIGLALVLPFYLLMLLWAAKLFLDRSNPWYQAAGGVVLGMVLALLVAAVGSQTFYPREGALGMWAAIGLMLRVWVERERALVRLPALQQSVWWGQPALALAT